jgi:hypothetical protein
MSERRRRFEELLLRPLSHHGFRLRSWEESEGFGDFVAVVGRGRFRGIRIKAVSDRGELYAVANLGDGWHVPAELEELVKAARREEARRVADTERESASMSKREFGDALAAIRDDYYADFLRRLAAWAADEAQASRPGRS